jgi:hypothetical protein
MTLGSWDEELGIWTWPRESDEDVESLRVGVRETPLNGPSWGSLVDWAKWTRQCTSGACTVAPWNTVATGL